MSLWAIVGNASWIVILVLLLLIAVSVVSWMIIIQRGQVLKNAQKSLIAFEDRFWSGMDLVLLYKEVQTQEHPDSGLEHIFKAGFTEFTRLRNQVSGSPEAIMEGTHRAMRVALYKEQEKLEKNLPFLATAGSTCPYLGLFGTVVGIMNSFRALAVVRQPTLASVAPGIAEALLTTAVGLVAAIPAVIAYNKYVSTVESLLSNYETFSGEFSSILHRKIYSQT